MTTIKDMKLPEPGETVSRERLMLLCHHYGKTDIIDYIKRHGWPENDFVADGCSRWPDNWFGKNIYPACFWHDGRYWCGVKGDGLGRLIADCELAKDVAAIASPELARTMFVGISVGGSENLNTPFKWGYGRI